MQIYVQLSLYSLTSTFSVQDIKESSEYHIAIRNAKFGKFNLQCNDFSVITIYLDMQTWPGKHLWSEQVVIVDTWSTISTLIDQ